MELATVEPAAVVPDGGADRALALGVGVGGECAGPGDVAMAGGVGTVAGFAEGPFAAGEGFAKGEVVRGDVLFAAREALFGDRKLVHERKAEVMFFGGEVHFEETAGVVLGGFPTDLAAEAGFVTGSLDVGQVLEKIEKDRFEEMPIFGAAGEEGAQPEFVALGFVNVDGAEIALAGGGDVKT